MSNEVRVPQLPESVADATLLDWHKSVGDFVNQGENLVDLETDKVVLELPAPISGTLKEIVIESGETVEGDALVAYIEAGEAPAAEAKATDAQTDKGDADKGDAGKADKAEPAAVETKSAPNTSGQSIASPAAKKMMAETGVTAVAGTGHSGRITKQDVLSTLAHGAAPMRAEERVPMTRLRKRIAERLLESQQTSALLTTFNEINMKPVMDIRSQYKDAFEKRHDTRLGFMSFFVKAATEALKEFPAVNAAIDGDDIVYHNYFDIGIAVSSPRGLVVPILRDTDRMSFADIEAQIREYGGKAKNGSLTIEEMTGGTFSITNGGVFGSMMSTPIVNPPQSAILGMHNIVERAVVENGEIVIRPMMYVALTYDHRIIDGRESVSFLVHLKNMLEDPARLLLDV
ncbi:2-oxoglutarate dehydrogenase complex dihydrolipoyllysine-residue succinyltransferase [Ostreibacterium oceani]|uniref:Dihydrolipoyllysine-residue succinyltransferase component of 2-oxoglutarate dehydrogenase complex n=1 Tax=Ostreibacterium oceani TaxID=2654998 RepID=A0A6N7ETW5_9GAMM|nr:2-oxoglutarate dehydrogenase complex dihydrolipoyllysine-residue succinyltransferase [Ostreibacterium oceani]MPV85991.1 2-oxoglutarate dehydrogenase complex dihydrolipoyllysine-residue succinyltransferase [Ostreibacterium oceani]